MKLFFGLFLVFAVANAVLLEVTVTRKNDAALTADQMTLLEGVAATTFGNSATNYQQARCTHVPGPNTKQSTVTCDFHEAVNRPAKELADFKDYVDKQFRRKSTTDGLKLLISLDSVDNYCVYTEQEKNNKPASCKVTKIIKTTNKPTNYPTNNPTKKPTNNPTKKPTNNPTKKPTNNPTKKPTNNPTKKPTNQPTAKTGQPPKPTNNPTKKPTNQPPTEEETISSSTSSTFPLLPVLFVLGLLSIV